MLAATEKAHIRMERLAHFQIEKARPSALVRKYR
jgi:hypothetical protein